MLSPEGENTQRLHNLEDSGNSTTVLHCEAATIDGKKCLLSPGTTDGSKHFSVDHLRPAVVKAVHPQVHRLHAYVGVPDDSSMTFYHKRAKFEADLSSYLTPPVNAE